MDQLGRSGKRTHGPPRRGRSGGHCHPAPQWSERPLACIVLKPGKVPQPEAFAAHLLQHGFAKWQVPGRYEFIDAIPRTSTGKFCKLDLRERFPA